MSTWTKFYIKTDNKDIVVDQLRTLTGIEETKIGDYPGDIWDNYLFDEPAKPTYLAVGVTSPGWITISHNSFNNLSDWSTTISKNVDTKVIVTIAQSVSDVYYFALFDKGKKIREIEVCYSADFKPKNFGQRFDFEDEQPGKREEYNGEIEYNFGFEEIEAYCRHFGLEAQTAFDEGSWTILKSGIKLKTINDFITAELVERKKPWWKLW